MSNVQLHDMGNAVGFSTLRGIENTIVPAVNIQVKNVPGFLGRVGEKPEWYGVYFEILFEDGDLWVVEQGWEQKKPDSKLVRVQQYKDWARRDVHDPDPRSRLCPWEALVFRGWEAFLVDYAKKVELHE